MERQGNEKRSASWAVPGEEHEEEEQEQEKVRPVRGMRPHRYVNIIQQPIYGEEDLREQKPMVKRKQRRETLKFKEQKKQKTQWLQEVPEMETGEEQQKWQRRLNYRKRRRDIRSQGIQRLKREEGALEQETQHVESNGPVDDCD
mmetsp:Transcript_18642/g.30649  ORF Transcript_18642/g.30649 Transcript_18642/m.30649 type:complete len:145 (+) Transcript_18642:65-499(+)|eukprot:CAMPEP_0184658824 /NCGR_PEP_ID=MMETSP0308-20130426/27026_1 /TAXON_ID=38269 /ORGANISM="Gloeochaete witrockiana, Strain SAG 46.84" /LENGTH=144 /DNA_ID=CAMNT_0027098117 /DNA_START=76 /DNA_END=510 /DNA_ORIENTATION=-